MPSTYEYVDDDLDALHLEMPTLTVLRPDVQRYVGMILQPAGQLIASAEDRLVRSADRDLIGEKMTAFFDLACERSADLAITPEYSCPWPALSRQIASGRLPGERALWIVGCESTSPKDLQYFINANEHAVDFIHEPLTVSEDFYDPVCMLFTVRRKASADYRTVCLIQFKTYPMGGLPLEAEHMIPGTKKYVLRNDENSIYLLTILCSESLEIRDPDTEIINFLQHAYFLVHLQLNPKPSTFNFRRYRTNYFNNADESANKELICVNWANGTVVGNTDIVLGGTSLYLKDPSIDRSDSRISENDDFGVSYHNWRSARAIIYQFVPREGIFTFLNFKCCQLLAAVQNRKRYGPQVESFLEWQVNAWVSRKGWALHCIQELCNGLDGDFTPLLNEQIKSIDKERLLALTAGLVEVPDWRIVSNLQSMTIEDAEFSNRLTFSYSDAVALRRQKRDVYQIFGLVSGHYLPSGTFFPLDPRFDDLRDGSIIAYSPDFPNENILSRQGGRATLAFISNADSERAKEVRDILMDSGHDQSRKLVIVAYRDSHEVLQYEYDHEESRVTDQLPPNSTSIRRTRES